MTIIKINIYRKHCLISSDSNCRKHKTYPTPKKDLLLKCLQGNADFKVWLWTENHMYGVCIYTLCCSV